MEAYPSTPQTPIFKGGHEEHEGRENHVEVQSLFSSGCPFFVSFVRFVVNRKTLVEHQRISGLI
jgi:hypothetical protein